MSRNTCIVSTGSFCAWLAFVLSGVALFAPYWYTSVSKVHTFNRGIVMTCKDTAASDRDCEWTMEATWEKVKDEDREYSTTGALMSHVRGGGCVLCFRV